MGRDQHHGHRGVYLTIGEAGVLKLHLIIFLNFCDLFLVEINSEMYFTEGVACQNVKL